MEILHKEPKEVKLQYLTDESQKDKKWDYHRSHTQDIEAVYRASPEFTNTANSLSDCSNFLGFAYKPDPATGEYRYKLRSAYFCQKRHCPVCQWRRSMRNVARFLERMPVIEATFPNHRWLFLTLTVKNCQLDALRAYIGQMNKGWQRLIQKKDWPADGWLRTTEVTRNPNDGSAHPHFHVLMMVKPAYFSHGYVTQEAWAHRWKEAMRLDYDPIIDIRAVRPKIKGQTLQAAVLETLKYGTKADDGITSADWLYGITKQLHKLRFLASGGALKDILKEELSNDEMIRGDEAEGGEEAVEELTHFQWHTVKRRYYR